MEFINVVILLGISNQVKSKCIPESGGRYGYSLTSMVYLKESLKMQIAFKV